jgi:hypothetical protein
MKMQNVPLDQIVWNPWRDMKLHPINTDEAKEHIRELRESIDDHGFFGGVKGRQSNGKIEIACGHMRIIAARKLGLESVPIFIGDMDEDQMLRLMTDENATQSGSHPGAIMNEVAAITRRLVEVLLQPEHFAPIGAKCFEGKLGYQQARGRLVARFNDPDKDGGVGWLPILRFLGDGNEDRAHRTKRQVIDAISSLKQANCYDDIVDNAMRKYPQPVNGALPSKSRTVVTTKQRTPRPKKLDERCATVFTNDHQFHAFRDAVTTTGALKAIPVDQQYALAKSIMKQPAPVDGEVGFKGATNKKQIGAPYIKKMVQAHVQEGLKKQRDIDQKERELYLSEQREARIEDELHSANASLRSLMSAIARLIDLAEEFPAHHKIGGFSARLDTLVGVIQQFSKKIK